MIQRHNMLDNIINSQQEILVTVDGQVKVEGEDYEDINNEIVFKQPPEAGSVIKVYKKN
tara:strand:+ start:1480 stop:1656 length:177 start_codon:yes stop_codon:yes gene_type:complete